MSKALQQIVERPVISEKSVLMSQQGRYTFRCRTSANKIEIRQAIEQLFDVPVADVTDRFHVDDDAVRVRVVAEVAEDDEPLALDALDLVGRRDEAALAVLERDDDLLADLATGCQRRGI